uniref:OmpA family protein n=1 Tax=Falsiphaeobacter marinintestinus TaxID=1492905 RepID=UPI0011B7E6B3
TDALTGDVVSGLSLDPATGLVTVAAGTPAGSYVVAYEICEILNPENCATAEITVPVRVEVGAIEGRVTRYVSGHAGVVVNLIDEETGLQVASTTTGSNGDYTFEGVAPGKYTVEFVNTTGEGSTAVAESDDYSNVANQITGIEVKGGKVEAAQDAILLDPAGVIYDSQSMAPIAGATVTLLHNGTPVPDAWLNGVVGDLNNTVTGSSGAYSFFLDPLIAQSGAYSIRVAHPSYIFQSEAIQPAAGVYNSGLGGGVVQIVPNAAPAAGSTTYYLDFNFSFDPGNAAGTSNGIVHNHIPLDRDLLGSVEDDVREILEDDLATTMTQLSNRMEGFSSGALDRLKSRDSGACMRAVNNVLERDNIHFDTDKDIIKPESYPVLDEIAEILGTCSGSSFVVAGHTDWRASEAYNQDLSERRVIAVIAALKEREVDTTGFVARGYGESRPIASNDTPEGMARNRRVEFMAIEEDLHASECRDSDNADRNMNFSANDYGVNFDRTSKREIYDCSTDTWTIVEGEVRVLKTDRDITQGMFNLSYRREKFVTEDHVRGYFLGAYGSRSDVSGAADGDIRGAGVFGGIYGAKWLRDDLYFDYYAGLAAGHHKFDLNFARANGAINASGHYNYYAGFAGMALSGQTEFKNLTLSPRAGIDLSYSPGGRVSLTATQSALSQSSSFDMQAMNGGRIYGELDLAIPTKNENVTIYVAPRFSCYKAIGNFDAACGFGGSLDIIGHENNSGFGYAIGLETEQAQGFRSGALSFSYRKRLWGGMLEGSASVSGLSDFVLRQDFRLQW